MCGISAIVSEDAGLRSVIGAMVAHQRERGPDNDDVYEHIGHCTLGHNRLSLLDLSPTGDQPMKRDRYVISYNGEVYNHQELRKDGSLKGATWRGTSDTETLLAMIERHGIRGALPKLNGMFAFAVWDTVEKKLHVATDPFGIKPLYVHHDPKAKIFACASSSAALLHLRPKWKVSTAGLARYFHLGGSNGLWEGIQRLDGGILGTYDARTGAWTTERWYTPKFNPNAAQEIEALVIDAIRKCATADVPVGLFYSGGIDSSVVASVMPGAHAFHLGTAELAWAQQGAKHFGLDLHLVDDNGDRVLEAHEHIAAATGEPTMAGHIPWLVSRQAFKKVKAAISANGADELFFGYDRHRGDPATFYAHLFRQAANYAPKHWPAPAWQVRDLRECDGRFPRDAQLRFADLQFYVQHDLNPTLDAASMCHSLEMRVPYLDVRVVEAALSLPFEKHGRKDILKRMLLKTGIGSAFVERQKLGFSMTKKTDAHRRYEHEAWSMARSALGIRPTKALSSRDMAYLQAASAGWAAWYNTWKHKMP